MSRSRCPGNGCVTADGGSDGRMGGWADARKYGCTDARMHGYTDTRNREGPKQYSPKQYPEIAVYFH